MKVGVFYCGNLARKPCPDKYKGCVKHLSINSFQQAMKSKWNDLSIKEKLAMSTAIAAFVAGWTLVGVAAFVPLLISEQGILWCLAQGLLYSSGVFGVSAYFQSESRRLKRDISDMLHGRYIVEDGDDGQNVSS